MNLCSQRSRSVRITPPHPSPGRGSFITAPCHQKSARIIPNPSTKKKLAVENRVRGFSCVFSLANPLKQPKESNWHFVSQPQKKFKTSAAELGSKSKSLKIFPKIRFSLLQKIKIFNLNLSGIPISAQGSPLHGPSLPPACPQRAVEKRRRPVAGNAAPARHLGNCIQPTKKLYAIPIRLVTRNPIRANFRIFF